MEDAKGRNDSFGLEVLGRLASIIDLPAEEAYWERACLNKLRAKTKDHGKVCVSRPLYTLFNFVY